MATGSPLTSNLPSDDGLPQAAAGGTGGRGLVRFLSNYRGHQGIDLGRDAFGGKPYRFLVGVVGVTGRAMAPFDPGAENVGNNQRGAHLPAILFRPALRRASSSHPP